MDDAPTNQESREPEAWFTPAEIAARLKLDPRRVGELLERREIEHASIAGEARVSGAALQAYLARATRPVASSTRSLRRRLAAVATLAVLGGVLGAGVLNAQSSSAGSSLVPYHGYLEEDGAPVDGKKYVSFCLTRTVDATACIWTENHVVDVSAGRFSVELGSVTSLDAVMAGTGDLYVGVTVDGVNSSNQPAGNAVALAGKQLLGSMPFARRASPGSNFVVDGTLQSNGLTVQNTATVTQSLNVGNQLTARQLNLSGKIIFNNIQRFCILATSCPAEWTDNGSVTLTVNPSSSCPFTPSGGLCYPRLCCT